ncbi:DUF2865 domain-containing protein [Roseibium salinum]|nr:DUF2865 domain-containing protein [Roseibium salinum]
MRTCDGYFFPLSFSTGKNHLPYDEARCSEICPAAPTELYVYRNPGGDRSQMISLAGKLYSEQPFANRYKAEFVQGCSCRAAQQSKKPLVLERTVLRLRRPCLLRRYQFGPAQTLAAPEPGRHLRGKRQHSLTALRNAAGTSASAALRRS